MRDKSRKVLEIIEVTGMDDKKISVNPIFQYEEESKTDTQNVTGSLKRIGELKNAGKLFDAGIGE